MDLSVQPLSPEAAALVLEKRARGRPRKYPPMRDLSPHLKVIVPASNHQSPLSRENIPAPPGYEKANGNKTHQVHGRDNPNDVEIGNSVHGVIDGICDCGYLLSVRVGNSETVLTGIVFKPGHYVPVCAENDVFPSVPMVQRHEIPIPNGMSVKRKHKISDSRETSGSSHSVTFGSATAMSKGKRVKSEAALAASPTVARGNVVPVTLRPVTSSQEVVTPNPSLDPPVNVFVVSMGQPHPVMPQTTTTLNEPMSSNPLISGGSQGGTVDGISVNSSREALRAAEAESVKLPGVPSKKLLSQVIKKIHGLDQLANNQSVDVNGQSANKTGGSSENNNDKDAPQFVEPLQMLHPDPNVPTYPVHKPFGQYVTGKMTELLQAVQGNMMQNQAGNVQESSLGSSSSGMT